MSKPKLIYIPFADLSKIEPNEVQRIYMPRHAEGISRSITLAGGFPPSMAFSVFSKPGGKYGLNTGHHRLAAAKLAKSGVWVFVTHEWSLQEIVAEGVKTKAWTLHDAVKAYAEDGWPDYITLLGYHKKGVPLGCAVSMLSGNHAGSGPQGEAVTTGFFKVKTTKSIDRMLKILAEVGAVCENAKGTIFVTALSALLDLEEFNCQQLIEKIKEIPERLKKRNDRNQMLDQLEEIYNFRSRSPVPIAFNAKARLRSRSAAQVKPKKAA